MKKKIAMLLAAALCMGTFAGCGNSTSNNSSAADNNTTNNTAAATESSDVTASADNVKIDTLNVYFVPSRDPDEIVTATEPLANLMQTELAGLGYDIGEVKITVGTTFEAVGEALAAGTADVGFIPGGTYVLYDDGADVILTATRDGLNKDSDNPADWNDGQPTEGTDKQAVSYRALFIAGPSDKGQELADKVNSGEELTWDDLNGANWSVMSSSSPAGYIYPALWLQDRYQKGITDLSSAVQSDSYASAFARLASGQIDVLVTYADARRDYDPIYNDTVCVSKTSPIMDDGLKSAIQTALINIGNTEEGKAVISIYSHNGYEPAQSSDYDKEREAQKLIQQLSAAN